MKFEKISFEQYKKDAVDVFINYEDIKLPKQATKKSAGNDIFSVMNFDLKPRQSILVPTGIKFDCDDDKFLLILPRSGQGFKYKVQLYNTAGVIDADYYNNPNNEGHIWVKMYNDSPTGETMHIHQGDAICQGIVMQYFKVDNSGSDDERVGGFGSTTKENK